MKRRPWDPLVNLRDRSSWGPRRPLLIAHRGGVLSPQAPENSLAAISLAADTLFDMVELDVREAKDGVPVLYHDRTLERSCRRDGRVEDYTSEELHDICHVASYQHIPTLHEAVGLCGELGLGIMFDVKADPDREYSAGFFDRVNEIVDNFGMGDSSVTISDNAAIREALGERCLLTVLPDTLDEVMSGKDMDLTGFFWFGMLHQLPDGATERLHELGALVIPAMNTFRYPTHAYMELARRDVHGCLALGVDGFQIDSVYAEFFSDGFQRNYDYDV